MKGSRYDKVVVDFDAMETVFLKTYMQSFRGQEPERIIIDLDPSDIRLCGMQEERFYHGYYCYLPMYVYCREYPLSV